MKILSQIISTIFCLIHYLLLNQSIPQHQLQTQLIQECTYEQLTLQFDCSYFSNVQFINQACQSSICAWNNGKFSKFTNCWDYKVSNNEDCINLRHDCIYNNLTKTIQPMMIQKIILRTGIDDKCIYKDSKCQIWTNCEYAECENCGYGYNHCIWNTQQNKCLSAQSCEQIGDQLCLFALQ